MELIVSSGSLTNSDEEIGKSEVQDWSFDDHVNELLQQTCEESESYEEDETDVDLDWYTATENLMLDELSILCRNLHLKLNNFSHFAEFDDLSFANTSTAVKSLSGNKKSSSSENIPILVERSVHNENDEPSNFERDSRARRSLPIGNRHFYGDVQSQKTISDNDDILAKESNINSFDNKPSIISEESKEKYQKHQISKEESNSKPTKSIVHLSNSSNDTEKDESRPGKKVGFSKTEIHFAPDTGKVNIVETDGKPPPTNRFRRRRRDHTKNNTNLSTSRLPVTHFGDTSYEKYIFGGAANPNIKNNAQPIDASSDKIRRNINESPSKDNNYSEKSIADEADVNYYKKSDSKQRGHITTINFITGDMLKSKKIVQDSEEASILNKDCEANSSADKSDSPITRTTKMTVHIPFIKPEIQHMRNIPFSSLRSAQLVLNVKPTIDNKRIEDLFSKFYKPTLPADANCVFQKEEDKIDKKLKEFFNIESMKPSHKSKNSNQDYPLSDHALNRLAEVRRIIDQQEEIRQRLLDGSDRSFLFEEQYNEDVDSDKPNSAEMKTVKTHKPVISQVEKDFCSNTITKMSKTKQNANLPLTRSLKKQKDNKDFHNNDEHLIYVNVFGNSDNGEDQLYENVFAMKSSRNKKKEKEAIQNDATSSQRKKSTKNENFKGTSKRIKQDTKLSDKKIKNLKNSETTLDLKTDSNFSSKTRSKKPEIIHKTAVFNMQNETMVKSPKLKETKSLRTVNDLIWGKKSKQIPKNKTSRNSLLKKPKKQSIMSVINS